MRKRSQSQRNICRGFSISWSQLSWAELRRAVLKNDFSFGSGTWQQEAKRQKQSTADKRLENIDDDDDNDDVVDRESSFSTQANDLIKGFGRRRWLIEQRLFEFVYVVFFSQPMIRALLLFLMLCVLSYLGRIIWDWWLGGNLSKYTEIVLLLEAALVKSAIFRGIPW